MGEERGPYRARALDTASSLALFMTITKLFDFEWPEAILAPHMKVRAFAIPHMMRAVAKIFVYSTFHSLLILDSN